MFSNMIRINSNSKFTSTAGDVAMLRQDEDDAEASKDDRRGTAAANEPARPIKFLSDIFK